MGLADLFKKGLEKTRSFFAGSFTRLAASSGHFDEDMLGDLEGFRRHHGQGKAEYQKDR